MEDVVNVRRYAILSYMLETTTTTTHACVHVIETQNEPEKTAVQSSPVSCSAKCQQIETTTNPAVAKYSVDIGVQRLGNPTVQQHGFHERRVIDTQAAVPGAQARNLVNDFGHNGYDLGVGNERLSACGRHDVE